MFWLVYLYKLQREASHFGVVGHILRCSVITTTFTKFLIYIGGKLSIHRNKSNLNCKINPIKNVSYKIDHLS